MATRSSKRCVALQFTLLITLFYAGFTNAEDWNQWRGSHRNGVAQDSPALLAEYPETGLKPLWISDEIPSARSGGWASPVIVNGKVYIATHQKAKVVAGDEGKAKYPYLPPEKRTEMTDAEYEEYERNRRDEQERRSKSYRFNEVVYCLDASTGKVNWKTDDESVYTRFPQSGTPAVIGGKLFVLGAGKVARCFDANSGKTIWSTDLPGEFRDEFMQSSFLVTAGVAVIAAEQIYGLDTATGDILWKVDDKTSKVQASPVAWESPRGPVVIANVSNRSSVCIDPSDGKEIWRIESDGGHSTPLVAGDRLLTFGNSRKKGLKCFKLSLDQPELLWTYQGAGDPGGSPVAVDGYAYIQGEKRLACVSLETGKAAWSTILDLARPRYSSLVAADEKVFYSFESLLCFRAIPDSYQPIVNAVVDADGLLADEEAFRNLLNITELEKTAEGQKQAEKLWRKTLGSSGPLPCCTPSIADGRLYLRLKNRIACYDIRQ